MDPLALVRRGVRRLADHGEAERLRLYRLELQVTVTSVPALVVDLVEDAGAGMDEVAWALPVPVRWTGHDREVATPRLSSNAWFRVAVAPKQASHGRGTESLLSRRLARAGLLLRGRDHPRGLLGCVIGTCGVEMVASIGEAVLHVGGGTARLLLPGVFPETFRGGLPGRRLRDLVSHPALDRGAYRVGCCRPNGNGSGLVVSFRVQPVPFAMPWDDRLASARAAGE